MAETDIYAESGLRGPLIFGHRGASADAPMNTLPAFELAVDQGADGIELDVHLSADGELVVIHDATVDATTDGTGEVGALTLAQLQELDAGAWFDARYTGTRVPTLAEVFDAVGDRLFINVEIKAPHGQGAEAKVAALIREHGLQRRVIVSSFNPILLKAFRDKAADIPIGYLYAPGIPPQVSQLMMGVPHEARHPMYTLVDAVYMEQARRFGYRVNTWTVNATDEAQWLAALNVDAIITDHPALMRAAIGG